MLRAKTHLASQECESHRQSCLKKDPTTGVQNVCGSAMNELRYKSH